MNSRPRSKLIVPIAVAVVVAAAAVRAAEVAHDGHIRRSPCSHSKDERSVLISTIGG
jgi:hypothetical protein